MRSEIVHLTELKRGDLFVSIEGRILQVHKKHISGGQVMSWPDMEKFPDFAPGEMVARILPDPVEEREKWYVYASDSSGIDRRIYSFEDYDEAIQNAIERSRSFSKVEIEHVRETVLSREEVKND
jgi:hypothetical protein